MNAEAFGKKVQEFLRTCGYTQKELANELALNYRVLNRKLNGTPGSSLKYPEIHDIILTLIGWQAIADRESIHQLLAAAEVDPTHIFLEEEWQKPPLSKLTRKEVAPPVSTDPNPPVHQLKHNLPAPTTRLIGRAWAVTRLQQLLGNSETRLVTLLGPGGSGKTRLALHVAHELVDSFAQGAWFVSFTGISDPDMVPLSIAQALNIKSAPDQAPLQGLIAYLRQKQMLLVLDNFEHIGEAGSIIESLLGAAPGLKVLITSRIVLHLPGEYEFSVPPLDLPDRDLALSLEVAALADYSAIQLFTERAQAALPNFALTSENAALVAQICACVDGLPLALELAAARIKVLSPAALLERLSQARLPLLSRVGRQISARHQTLSNTIKWSYDLLNVDEQTWFRRLSVFVGGWTLESSETMIREIAADEKKPAAFLPLDLIAQLVDNSLLVRIDDPHGYARFLMLSTLREYALERLEAHGETEWMFDWHASYYLRKAEKGELGLRGPRQLTVLARFTDARANMRAALEWTLHRAREGQLIRTFSPPDNTPQEVASCRTLSRHRFPAEEVPALEICLRLATALRAYWEWQGYLTEGRHWLTAALELPLPDGAGPTLLAARARSLSEAARLVVLQNAQEQALALAEESIEIWRQLDDPPGLATALLHRGWALHGQGHYTDARDIYQTALELLSPHEDTWLYAQILVCLGATAGFTSDFEGANRYYTRCRELFEQIGDKSAIADAWKDQGGILLLAGNLDEGINCLLASIQICRELDHKQYIATALGSLSYAFGLRLEPDAETASLYSAQVQGAAESLMTTIGLTPWTRSTGFFQAVRQHIRSRVDDQRWQAAMDAGRALTLDQALELVFRLGKRPL